MSSTVKCHAGPWVPSLPEKPSRRGSWKNNRPHLCVTVSLSQPCPFRGLAGWKAVQGASQPTSPKVTRSSLGLSCASPTQRQGLTCDRSGVLHSGVGAFSFPTGRVGLALARGELLWAACVFVLVVRQLSSDLDPLLSHLHRHKSDRN